MRTSVRVAEKIHGRLEYLGATSLTFVTIFDFLMWKYANAYWNAHEWLALASAIALALVTAIDWAVLIYGKRIRRLERIEEAEKEEKHKDELDELRATAAESSMTAQLVSASVDRHLSDDDRAIMKDRLSRYRGQKFRVVQIGYGIREAKEFAEELRDALKTCGWIEQGFYFDVPADSQIMAISGVSPQIHNFDITSSSACKELVRTLVDIRVAVGQPHKQHLLNGIPSGVVEIGVGRKVS